MTNDPEQDDIKSADTDTDAEQASEMEEVQEEAAEERKIPNRTTSRAPPRRTPMRSRRARWRKCRKKPPKSGRKAAINRRNIAKRIGAL